MGFLDSAGLAYLVGKIKAAIPGKTSQLVNDAGFLTEHQDVSGKLDKTATAAAATKLATARTILTNLAIVSAASFNGTANVTPGVTGVLPVANGGTGSSTEKYLPLTGGTITGNLTLKGSGNYGNKINLGDGDYVHISEPTDDCLEIKAKKVDFVLSDTSGSGLTVNGSPLGGGGGLELAEDFTLAAEETKTVTVESGVTYMGICEFPASAMPFFFNTGDMGSTTLYRIGIYVYNSGGSAVMGYNARLRRTSSTTVRFEELEGESHRILLFKLG